MEEYADPVPSEAAAWVEWDEEVWYYNKRAGYYYNRSGTLLHRAIWAAVHGPIPDNHEVNHINAKRYDNRLVNLELLTIAEHRSLPWRPDDPRRLDGPEGVEHRKRRGRITAEMWRSAVPRPVVCQICGTQFYSIGTRAKNCSKLCRDESVRRRNAEQRAARRAGKRAQ
jgi:hypothetical protein